MIEVRRLRDAAQIGEGGVAVVRADLATTPALATQTLAEAFEERVRRELRVRTRARLSELARGPVSVQLAARGALVAALDAHSTLTLAGDGARIDLRPGNMVVTRGPTMATLWSPLGGGSALVIELCPPTVADVVTACFARMARYDASLRRYRSFVTDDDAPIRPSVSDLRAALRELGHARQREVPRRRAIVEEGVDSIDGSTHLLRSPHALLRLTTAGGRWALSDGEEHVVLPREGEEALRFIHDAESLRPSEIPGPLDVESKIALARRLCELAWFRRAPVHFYANQLHLTTPLG